MRKEDRGAAWLLIIALILFIGGVWILTIYIPPSGSLPPSVDTPSATKETSPTNYKDYTWDDWKKEEHKDAVVEDFLRKAQEHK